MVPHLDRATLQSAFAQIGERALAEGRIVEIAVYGGAALILTVQGRVATRDVDAVVQNDAAWLRKAVSEIAEANGWPPDWLNDGVKGFLSARDQSAEARRLFRTYPSEGGPGLRVFVATPAYLFAMKCMAMRIAGVDATQDRRDIELLASILAIANVEQALAVVGKFYPVGRISPKTQFGLEEIFGARTDVEAKET